MVGLPPEERILNQKGCRNDADSFKLCGVSVSSLCVFSLPPEQRFSACLLLLLVSYCPLALQSCTAAFLRTFADNLRGGRVVSHRHETTSAADASMSYETAQKVQQQQLKDRVAYAVIILLGFVALYINIKRAANEQAAWEKEHS